MTTTVYAKALSQGTVATSSVRLDAITTVTGAVQLDAKDLADPAFALVLTLYVAVRPGWWEPRETVEWTGGPNATPPTVTHSGPIHRAKLTLDLSRPASVGASLSY